MPESLKTADKLRLQRGRPSHRPSQSPLRDIGRRRGRSADRRPKGKSPALLSPLLLIGPGPAVGGPPTLSPEAGRLERELARERALMEREYQQRVGDVSPPRREVWKARRSSPHRRRISPARRPVSPRSSRDLRPVSREGRPHSREESRTKERPWSAKSDDGKRSERTLSPERGRHLSIESRQSRPDATDATELPRRRDEVRRGKLTKRPKSAQVYQTETAGTPSHLEPTKRAKQVDTSANVESDDLNQLTGSAAHEQTPNKKREKYKGTSPKAARKAKKSKAKAGSRTVQLDHLNMELSPNSEASQR